MTTDHEPGAADAGDAGDVAAEAEAWLASQTGPMPIDEPWPRPRRPQPAARDLGAMLRAAAVALACLAVLICLLWR